MQHDQKEGETVAEVSEKTTPQEVKIKKKKTLKHIKKSKKGKNKQEQVDVATKEPELDENGNIIKGSKSAPKTKVFLFVQAIRTFFAKRPRHFFKGKKASYEFGVESDGISVKSFRSSLWPFHHEGNQNRRLFTVVAGCEPQAADVPVRYRSTDCL